MVLGIYLYNVSYICYCYPCTKSLSWFKEYIRTKDWIKYVWNIIGPTWPRNIFIRFGLMHCCVLHPLFPFWYFYHCCTYHLMFMSHVPLPWTIEGWIILSCSMCFIVSAYIVTDFLLSGWSYGPGVADSLGLDWHLCVMCLIVMDTTSNSFCLLHMTVSKYMWWIHVMYLGYFLTCTWPWVSTCDVSQIPSYHWMENYLLPVTIFKYTQ